MSSDFLFFTNPFDGFPDIVRPWDDNLEDLEDFD